MKDEELLSAFRACTLPKENWTHATHVHVAWLMLSQFGLEKGSAAVREGIKRYNQSQGNTDGYHETVTTAFLKIIHYRRKCQPDENTWADFANRNADLLRTSQDSLSRYYSEGLLNSEKAKSDFVSPDLSPLPIVIDVRPVKPEDAAQMLEIYRPHVEEGTVSFEEVTPTLEGFETRIEAVTSAYPWMVGEKDGKILGFCYASKHRERAAYRWSAEVAIYVAEEYKGMGVGKALYSHLLSELRNLNLFNAYAGIGLPNEDSVRLHEAVGFTPVGVYRGVGYKMGSWHDVGWWQLELQPRLNTPREPIPWMDPGDDYLEL